VRCGKCGEVFDGIASLTEQGPEPLLLEPSPQLGLFDPSRRPAQGSAPGDDDEPLPAFMAEAPRRRPALWGILAFLAATALLAQTVYHLRSEIAAAVPAAREPLEAACRVLDCVVPLPRWPQLLGIDSYEVRADPRRQGFIVLHAVIRNRARFPQEYPALHLALTDESNRQLASRILLPPDYLDPKQAARLIGQGIEAGGEASLTVHFDASRVRASGYELVLFYPS